MLTTRELDRVSARFVEAFADLVLSTIASNDRGRAEHGEPPSGVKETAVVAGYLACSLCKALANDDVLRSMPGAGHA
ncbi:hypothetical protein F0160_21065 [Paraburkholderia sp. JPY303]|uniref:hypothetical protein n=1 Tax=Paraburkholderia atlantica TaxID=2654982 RepID=UPI001591B5E1|nr:hypothetical protein [Paraburkholderia atlantica]NUY32980.1 hypothetical protein [Paraburkholderia atlantica]